MLIGVIASSREGISVDYSLDSATTYGTELDVSSQTPEQIFWANDKLYVVDDALINQWTLEEGVDNIDDASDDTVSQASTQTRTGFQISPDGINIVGGNYTSPVDNYGATMSTAWLLSSTGSSSAYNLNLSEVGEVRGWYWKPDGSEFYVIDNTADTIETYSLSVNWSGTATHQSSKILDISTYSNLPAGLLFSPDGKFLYYCNRGADELDIWEMSTAWDPSTATYHGAYDIDTETTTPYDLCWYGDDKMLVLDTTQQEILQINL